MAKRSNSNKSSEIKRVKPKLVSVKVEQEMVVVESLRDVIYKYQTLSGDWIVFNGAGSRQSVTREDATILLSKIREGCNCGVGARLNHIFKEV